MHFFGGLYICKENMFHFFVKEIGYMQYICIHTTYAGLCVLRKDRVRDVSIDKWCFWFCFWLVVWFLEF